MTSQASQAADSIASLTTRLRTQIDTGRRGHPVNPLPTLEKLIAEATALKKELRRAA